MPNGTNQYTSVEGTPNSPNFTPIPQENFNTEEMRGSMQNIRSENIGEYGVV